MIPMTGWAFTASRPAINRSAHVRADYEYRQQGATFGIGQLTHVVRDVEGSAIIASAVNAESRRSRPAAGHCVRRQVLLQKLCDAIGLPPVLCAFMVLSVCIGLLGIARSIQKGAETPPASAETTR